MADEPKPDPMDVDEVANRLNESIALQQRSVLQFSAAAGSMFGLDVQGLTPQLQAFAQSELADTQLLVEKLCALGGNPTTEVRRLSWNEDPHEAIAALVEVEDETIATLHQVIPVSGQEPRSEALEHLIEHVIMRKQNQVDWMRRAMRRA